MLQQLLDDTLGYCPDLLIVLRSDRWTPRVSKSAKCCYPTNCFMPAIPDEYGKAKFDRSSGRPVTVPYDLEEFNSVVRALRCLGGGVANSSKRRGTSRLEPILVSRSPNRQS